MIGFNPGIRVKENDGSPDVSGVSTLNLTGLTLTNDGAGVVTITGSSASPGGSSGQVQFNSAGSFGGMAGSAVAASGNLLTLTSQAATDTPLAVTLHASQSAAGFKYLNSSGGNLIQFTSAGAIALYTNGSSRFGTLSYDDPAGSYVFGRSDHSDKILVTANSSGPSAIVSDDQDLYIRCGSSSSTVTITGNEAGSTSVVDFNRRPSDNSTGVGGAVRCWTKTGQTDGALQVLAPGGGSQLWMVRANGGVMPASLADGDAANNTLYYSTTASKLVYKDSGGTVNALY